MKNPKMVIIIGILLLAAGYIFATVRFFDKPLDTEKQTDTEIVSGVFDEKAFKTEEEWKEILSADEYHILRRAGTEVPFTGALNGEKRKGTYFSAGCDKPLFRSEQKYDSGTGWPSFWTPISENALVLRREDSPLDDRIEVLDTCGNHLGHLFEDGPEPTGKRYCMNSLALRFIPDEEQ